MKRFSIRLSAVGPALGALTAAAVLAAGAYARTSQPGAQDSGQPVIDWNRILLSIVNTPGAQPASIQPTRNFAILHAAIYDAVNSIDRSHEPYLIAVRAPRDASETAAADAAAHSALVGLYPAQQSVLDVDYAAELANVPDGPAKDQGVRLGELVAGDLLAIRANDGSNVAPPPFVAGTNPGDYRPTPPNFPTPVFTSWGQVTPFVLDRGDQFRPAAPPALTSDAYAAAVNEVKSLGSATSMTRTADQTQIGQFWNPPIQNFWNQIAATVALANRSDLPTTARLFADLNLSFADSAIAFYGRQVHLPALAACDGDPTRRQRRQPEHGCRPELAPTRRQHRCRPVVSRCAQHDQRGRGRRARRFLRRQPVVLGHVTGATRRVALVQQLHRCRGGGRSQPHLLRPAHAARPRRRAHAGPRRGRLRSAARFPARSALLRQVAGQAR
jgi:hypothetical protein